MGMTRVMAFACVAACAPVGALAQQTGAIIDQNRADRAVAPRAAQAPILPENPAAQAEINAAAPAGVKLAAVTVDGSTLSKAAIDAVMAPLIGRALDRITLNSAANALSLLYKDSEVALYTIRAPQQDLSAGRLRLIVTEGYAAQVAIIPTGHKKAVPLIGRYADPVTKEKPLTRPTLERQVLLISDIPGVKATNTFLQGRTAGEVVMTLPVEGRKSDMLFSLSTRGAQRLGRNQVQADFSRYSLARAGDSTTLTLSAPTDPRRFQYVSLTHSTPIGDDGLRVQGSASYLRTRPPGGTGDGDAKFGSLQASYPLLRRVKQNIYLTGAVDTLESSNALFGVIPATETTRTARTSAIYTFQDEKQSVLATVAGSYGGADFKGGALFFAGDDSFTKLNLRLGYDRVFDKKWVVHAKAIGQYTGDRLATSELLSLGGDEFGRAFMQASAMGDYGMAGSLELGWRATAPGRFNGSEIYAFADTGKVTYRSRIVGTSKYEPKLSSIGVGVRAAWKRDTLIGLEAAYAADAPAGVRSDQWRLAFNLRSLR